MQKLAHPTNRNQHGKGKSRQSNKVVPGNGSPSVFLCCRNREGAAGKRQIPKRYDPKNSAVGGAGKVGNMNEKHKQANHETEQRSCKPGVFPGRYAQGRGNETRPHEERPENEKREP